MVDIYANEKITDGNRYNDETMRLWNENAHYFYESFAAPPPPRRFSVPLYATLALPILKKRKSRI